MFDPQPPGPPGVGWVNFLYCFSGQFMTFPGLLDFLTHLNFPLRHPFGGARGGSIFLGRNHPQVYPHMRAAKSDGVGWGGVG